MADKMGDNDTPGIDCERFTQWVNGFLYKPALFLSRHPNPPSWPLNLKRWYPKPGAS